MSYILDALRRSQAERERGQVPGLDARPGAVAAVPPGPSGQRWRWLGVAALLLVIAALAALWGWRPAPSAAPSGLPSTGPTPERAPAVVVMRAADPALDPAPATATGPAPAATTAAAPANLPTVVSAPPPPATLPSLPAKVQRPAAGPPAPSAAAGTGTPAAPATAAPAAVTPRSPTPLSALTAAQRRELPPLVLGGSIWSESALGRFVIVNGQVVREGETAAPGVVVERIEPKAVLLRWRDLRVEVPL